MISVRQVISPEALSTHTDSHTYGRLDRQLDCAATVHHGGRQQYVHGSANVGIVSGKTGDGQRPEARQLACCSLPCCRGSRYWTMPVQLDQLYQAWQLSVPETPTERGLSCDARPRLCEALPGLDCDSCFQRHACARSWPPCSIVPLSAIREWSWP